MFLARCDCGLALGHTALAQNKQKTNRKYHMKKTWKHSWAAAIFGATAFVTTSTSQAVVIVYWEEVANGGQTDVVATWTGSLNPGSFASDHSRLVSIPYSSIQSSVVTLSLSVLAVMMFGLVVPFPFLEILVLLMINYVILSTPRVLLRLIKFLGLVTLILHTLDWMMVCRIVLLLILTIPYIL